MGHAFDFDLHINQAGVLDIPGFCTLKPSMERDDHESDLFGFKKANPEWGLRHRQPVTPFYLRSSGVCSVSHVCVRFGGNNQVGCGLWGH